MAAREPPAKTYQKARVGINPRRRDGRTIFKTETRARPRQDHLRLRTTDYWLLTAPTWPLAP